VWLMISGPKLSWPPGLGTGWRFGAAGPGPPWGFKPVPWGLKPVSLWLAPWPGAAVSPARLSGDTRRPGLSAALARAGVTAAIRAPAYHRPASPKAASPWGHGGLPRAAMAALCLGASSLRGGLAIQSLGGLT